MTISSRVELIARRRVVDAFIKADSVSISLYRPGEKVQTPSGGYTRQEPFILDPQEMAIIPSKRRYDKGIINSEAGSIIKSEYLLLCRHTANVKENDSFVWLGENYEVREIHPTRSGASDDVESILCAIELRGADNG